MINIKIINNKNANFATKLFDSKKSLTPLIPLFVTPISLGDNWSLDLLLKILDIDDELD
jgi:hypothetical protein